MFCKCKEPVTLIEVKTEFKYVPEGTQEIFVYYLGTEKYGMGLNYTIDHGVTENAEKAAAWTKADKRNVAEYKVAYKLADGTYLQHVPEYKALKVAT